MIATNTNEEIERLEKELKQTTDAKRADQIRAKIEELKKRPGIKTKVTRMNTKGGA